MAVTRESVPEVLDRLTALVPDFPEPGIVFRDLSPVFADGPALTAIVDALVEPHAGTFDVVAGVEARGFVLAAAAAYSQGVGMLPVRKAGKLPRETIAEQYALEYGTAALEVQPADLPAGCRVLLLDDVLATGGTLAAAAKLIERAGWSIAGIGVVLELDGLGGRGMLAGRGIHALHRV